ncbi:hypothetical protein INT43_007872 [Umbelopsis isabellina]|uniref:Uncharacterized protein n=1 Tax=Mortierella isabellina TaxID=91625 RepID=A0A8H7UBV9_MORIS|nr:hypothetical protein INT43_007872 [Umbelopsis isabellina]
MVNNEPDLLNIFGVIAAAEETKPAAPDTSTTKVEPKTTTTPKPVVKTTTTAAPPPAPTTHTTPKPSTSVPPASSTHSSVVSSSVASSSVPVSSSSSIISSSVAPATSITFVTPTTSSSSPLPTTNAAASTHSSSSNTNLIGPVVGAVAGAAVLLGVGILLYRRRRGKREQNDADRTFSDYLAGSEAMHGSGKGNWDQTYNARNSTNMRSPASIAAGIHQQPSPRMMPAVGGLTAGAIAASQQNWSTSSHQSPDNTLVGSPQMSQMYPGGNYGHYDYNGYYNQQPEYPHGQGYYEYSADPYQYPGNYQPYFDPESEQYVYPPSGSEAPAPLSSASPTQAPNTYDQQPQQSQTDYRTSPLPAPPRSAHSIRSSVDEPRFPTYGPASQAAHIPEPTSSAVHKPDSSTAGQN